MMKLKDLNRVGEKTEKALKKLGLETILDLLFYFPYRYDSYQPSPQIADLQVNQNYQIKGELKLIRNKRSFRRKMFLTEALVFDKSGAIEVLWFNQPFIAKNIKAGDQISLAGKITYNHGRPIMLSPVYEKIQEKKELLHTSNLVPIYSLSSNLSQKQIRFLMHQAFKFKKKIPDYLPSDLLKRHKLPSIEEALQKIHFPNNEKELEAAINRFKFSELFLFQLKSHLLKETLNKKKALSIKPQIKTIKKFTDSLPFQLTADQKKASWQIIKDLEKEEPMSRLLQGDVSSGKTIVALIAALNCLSAKRQVTFMAPSEVLSQQHFATATKLLKKFKIKIALISSKNKESNFEIKKSVLKKDLDQHLAQEADLIFGTHSLIQEKINLPRLSLVIIDEQHRFGVKQRQEIIKKNPSEQAHFLSLTATPIPRSLALISFYGLNFSQLKEKPSNRSPIITKIVEPQDKDQVYEFMRTEIAKGHQAFIICPLIDPSDKLGVKSLKEEYQKLKKDVFPDLEIAIIHGKMKSAEKIETMNKFKNNESKILLATSIIEVGIDIPTATIILIEGAERFGLAQLHQFRGRVGRSSLKSYCFLALSSSPQEENISLLNKKINYQSSIQRLKALQKYDDGLSLAKIDLKTRGSGNFYGTEQSGLTSFRFASFFDYDLIKKAEEEVRKITQEDPQLKKHSKILRKIETDLLNTHLE